MSVLDRFGSIVKAEWSHRFGRRPRSAADAHDTDGGDRGPTVPRRSPAVVDVDGALRVLELTGAPSLQAVRAQYRALAERYYPKTRSASDDEAHAAHVVIDALTDALEVLEEHLLPSP